MQRPACRRVPGAEPCPGIARGIGGREWQLRPFAARRAIGQPVAKIEQRAVRHVRRLRPCGGKLAREVETRLAACISDQHVGDPARLAAGQPGNDESVRNIERLIHIERAAGDHQRDHRNALLLELLHRRIRAGQVGIEGQSGAVTLEFGIGLLAEHDHCGIGPLAEAAIGRMDCVTAAGFHSRGQPGKDRRRAREVAVVDPAALPTERPAAAGAGDVIGALARDQQSRTRPDRQHALILEQHQRLSHGLAGDRAVFGRAEQLVLARQRPLGRLACLEQAEPRLHAQDTGHRLVDPRHGDFPGLRLGQ